MMNAYLMFLPYGCKQNMAKLYFNYGVMNAGKSLNLIKDAYNYEESGRRVLAFKPAIDTRSAHIASRVGLWREALTVAAQDDMYAMFDSANRELLAQEGCHFSAVFVDECHFLTPRHIVQLSDIVDELSVPVLCYGLRTDAFGQLFDASARLFAIADEINEIKGMCRYSESKATFVVRLDDHGQAIKSGQQICIGGNEHYVSCSRKEYKKRMPL